MTEDQRLILLQWTAYQYSFVGDGKKALELADRSVRQTPYAIPRESPFTGTEPVDALAEIVREASKRQVVILNEAHHVPRGRFFATQVALALRKLGFEYFAAETFAEPATLAEAWRRGYPSRKMGFYTCEPGFGDLVRQVMRVGYRAVSYEGEIFYNRRLGPLFGRVRETEQADNLIARIFSENPKARVLIYCGYSHATETWDKVEEGQNEAWMAARLKRLTGIDPFTIDQTAETAHSAAALALPEYQFAQSRGWLDKPKVFRRRDGTWATFGEYAGKVDMQVFTPSERLVNGRPTWLGLGGRRKPLGIPQRLVPKEGRVLLQAFVWSEPADAVPMDQVLLRAGHAPPVLMLPTGRYRLVLQRADGAAKPAGSLSAR